MRLRAYAKVNLVLEVLRRRPDGYHEIASILQNIALYDILHLERSSTLQLTCSEESLDREDNLVWQAATRLREFAGVSHGARIHLEKRIPAPMGLGGGSSDAAATLAGLVRLWGLQMPLPELSHIAAGLGSDVPFFLVGGTARADGRGDRVTVLPSVPRRWVLLLYPDINLEGKTGRLYRSLPPDTYSDGAACRMATQAIQQGCFPSQPLYNTFDAVASHVYPGFDDARRALHLAGASEVHLCGSGPGLYSLVDSQTKGERVRKHLQDEGWPTYLVSTIEKGWESICQD